MSNILSAQTVALFDNLKQALRQTAGILRMTESLDRYVSMTSEPPKSLVRLRQARDIGQSMRQLIYSTLDSEAQDSVTQDDHLEQVLAVSHLCAQVPGNGLGDCVIWPAFRLAGMHREAEEWTAATNEVRRIRYELQQERLQDPARAQALAGMRAVRLDLDGNEAWEVLCAPGLVDYKACRLATVSYRQDPPGWIVESAVRFWPKLITEEMVVQVVLKARERDQGQSDILAGMSAIRRDVDGHESWDVSSELVRGRLATVSFTEDPPGWNKRVVMPAVRHPYWPEQITEDMVIRVVREAREKAAEESRLPQDRYDINDRRDIRDTFGGQTDSDLAARERNKG